MTSYPATKEQKPQGRKSEKTGLSNQPRPAEAQSEYLLEYKISGNSLAGERALRLSGSHSTDPTEGAPHPGDAQLETSDPGR
jgi:hypothetical protein